MVSSSISLALSALLSSSAGSDSAGGAGSTDGPGGGPGALPGGAAEVQAALRPPATGGAGGAVPLLLLEGPGPTPGRTVPQHQSHGILLLPAGQGRSVPQLCPPLASFVENMLIKQI